VNALLRRIGLDDQAKAHVKTPPSQSQDHTLALNSAIYDGWVQHRRHAPHAHAFRYRTAMLYLDLDEIDRVFARRWLWSANQRNVAEFCRSDYLRPLEMPLAEAVRARVAGHTGRHPQGPVRLLTHLRYFGHSFNPVSFYYCYAADGTTLEAVVAEITNTPWKERHAYVLPVDTAKRHGKALHWEFEKNFHVSPFLPLDRDYSWRFTAPDDALRVHMDVSAAGKREFDATLVLQRRKIDGAGLARVLLRFPAMSLRVLAAIHWQALRLYLKGNPVYDHPGHSEDAHE
jgi:DUF1365 family protein